MGFGRDAFIAWSEHLGRVPVHNRSETFVTERCWIDMLPGRLVLDLKAAIEQAPLVGIDTAPDTVPALEDGYALEEVMREHNFKALDDPSWNAYLPVIEHLKPRVAAVIGAPWAILNVRSWTTGQGPTSGPNAWHRDGFPKEMFKLMIYLTPIGGEYGGIQLGVDRETIRTPHGPAGTWVLFYNSVLQHRGIAPERKGLERVASEITLVAAREFDLEPRFLGMNARFPSRPSGTPG